MAKRFPSAALTWGLPGFVMQCAGIATGLVALSVAGTAALVVGLMHYMRGKGYPAAWGLWGIVPIMGPLLLLFQQRQPGVTTEETLDTILLEEDPHIRGIESDAERARKPVPVAGGWPFLAVMAPVGIFIILFSAHLPHAVAPARDGVVERPAQVEPAPQTPPAESPKPAAETRPVATPKEPEKPPASSEEKKEAPVTKPQPGASEPKPPQESPYVTRFKQLRKGMTYEQVVDIVGEDSVLVSGTIGGDKIAKWENPDKSFFAARFHDNVLVRTTNLNFPPPKKELQEMAAELAQPAEQPPAAPEKKEPAGDGGKGDADEGRAPSDGAEPTDMAASDEKPPERKSVIRVGEANKPEPRMKKAQLPRFSQRIDRGPYDVHVQNTNPFPIQVGLRAAAKRGRNVTIPPNGMATFYLANGDYNIYYVNTQSPVTLYDAGVLTVNSPPVPIVIGLR